jgi:hypothetical protein
VVADNIENKDAANRKRTQVYTVYFVLMFLACFSVIQIVQEHRLLKAVNKNLLELRNNSSLTPKQREKLDNRIERLQDDLNSGLPFFVSLPLCIACSYICGIGAERFAVGKRKHFLFRRRANLE